MADVNYRQLVLDIGKHDNYAVVFRSTLEDMAAKVDFSHVKSCVAFGTGGGEREIEFARRLLPNLRSFTAVEPDPESVRALRANFQDGKLPGVETSVVETTLESWSGVQKHVDAVLLFDMLLHIHITDRKALFQKLITQYLSYGGVVAIISSTSSFTRVILERLGMSQVVYDNLEGDMVDAGFHVVLKQDYEVVETYLTL